MVYTRHLGNLNKDNYDLPVGEWEAVPNSKQNSMQLPVLFILARTSNSPLFLRAYLIMSDTTLDDGWASRGRK